VVTFSGREQFVHLTCSLNNTIPSSANVSWLIENNNPARKPPNEIMRSGNTSTLLIRNPQPSDAGVYQCVFNDIGWQLKSGEISLLYNPSKCMTMQLQ